MAFNTSVLNLTTIQKGSQGIPVIAWQRFLQEAEYPVGTVDGDFGGLTDTATRNYQAKNALPVKGLVDNTTYALALKQGFIFKVPNFSSGLLLSYLGFGIQEVQDLQANLNNISELHPPLDVDGNFGPTSTKGLGEAYLQRDVRIWADFDKNLSNATKQKLGTDYRQALDILTNYAKRLRFMLSGPQWYYYFPTSRAISDLASPFRENVQTFQKAMIDAGAQIIITATYRPTARAYLMHYAAQIDRGEIEPGEVPPMDGVSIDWVHYTQAGSLLAASQMIDIYGIGGNPVALQSLHTQRLAIDWNITWQGTLKIRDGNGNIVQIGDPRNGSENQDLFDVGASYGVYKLTYDPPHWSYNGH